MTKDLVVDALKGASRNLKLAQGSIFHSDRGSQYASKSFRKILDVFGLEQSMSRRGNCYDNGMMESFFASLMKELVYHTRFRTREDAKSAICKSAQTASKAAESMLPDEKDARSHIL